MRLLFITVFGQIEYVNLLEILLISLLRNGNSKNISILIYTTSHFMEKLNSLPIVNEFNNLLPGNIWFVHNDNIKGVYDATRARLDLFEILDYQEKTFESILYLDTDIVITGDVNKLFDIIESSETPYIHALEEGDFDTHDPIWDYYGRTLFTNEELDKLKGVTAFSSGVMGFKNCTTIQNLFTLIKDDIGKRGHLFKLDQPYIVHNTVKYNLLENQKFKQNVAYGGYDTAVMELPHRSTSIIHFAGGVGGWQAKLSKMSSFLNRCFETMQR